MTKRSTHCPLKERVVVQGDAERLLKGRDAEGSFQAGNQKFLLLYAAEVDFIVV